jgi:hypothetical protein
MAFGIIRARNLSMADLTNTDRHNARRYDSSENYPANINPDGQRWEVYHKPYEADLTRDEATLEEVIKARIEDKGVSGIKSNSNVAIEYVVTINDKKVWKNYYPSGFFSNTGQWLEEKHGRCSIVAKYEHYDESNPHAHFILVPIIEKNVKWKNSRGEGIKKEARLNTREFTGGRDKLRKLQDDFFEHLVDKYGHTLGVTFYRGTLVENQTKKYIQQTLPEIAELKSKIVGLNDEIEKSKVAIEIKEKEALKAKLEADLLEIEKGKLKYKNWESKGTKDNPLLSIFHTEKEVIKKSLNNFEKGNGFER